MLVEADGGIDGAGRQHIDAAHRHALGRVGIGLDGQRDEIDVEQFRQLVGDDMDHLLEGRGLDDADDRRLDAVLDDLVLLGVGDDLGALRSSAGRSRCAGA
jgi:hypothetical protein